MKPSITVASLGPGDPALMTLQTADALRHAKTLILRTARHRAAAWLEEQQLAYTHFDDMYDSYDDFDDMHRAMARKLWQAAAESPVTYAVIDAGTDGSVSALQASMPEGASLTVLPGVSMADACLAALPVDMPRASSVRILPATDWEGAAADPRTPLLITEIWNPVLAGDVKLWLTDLYDDEQPVVLYPSSAKVNRKPVVIPLMELDRQRTYDHTVCLYIPAVGLQKRQRYCFGDLAEILSIRRSPGGCSWGREQNHEWGAAFRPCFPDRGWS